MNLQKLHEENDELSRRVKEQNISPQEVTRMNTEHDTLQRSLIELRRKVAETQQAYHNLEIALANRTADLEKAMDEYMGFVWKLDLHPQPANSTLNINFEINLDMAKEDPKKLIVGEDLRKTITPTIIEFTRTKRQQRGEAEDEAIQVDFVVDKLAAEQENLEEDMANIEIRANVLLEQAEALRKVRSCIR